ncbi:hypothetical protein A2310_02940 [candidate division WOR-1 bacterium RIFOXYB2_FULL_37_13]|uniref:DNA 3'-5' helicase n=1 Tax=candidate division WOR-1 bacterium RIFOXYB2_FULL_37_13 TaxID=1802579 RepID=A0A1F4SSY2_UNCSA|nr:MAG: hypothetical protein A2310_02940 [candidate division WOR-1 bacterium RIFOXYB2_FULL_37_13]
MEKTYTLRPSFSPNGSNYTIPYDKDLTDEQLPVVKSQGGPSLVIAGAGSGKTRTITYRVAYLVESGVPLHNILLVTFTNKAAREMKFRVEGLLRRDLKGLWAGTYHHIGNLILRKHAKKLGYDKNFTILDRADSKDLFDKSIKEAGIDTKTRKFPKGDVLQDVYSYIANTLQPFSEVIQNKYPHLFEFQAEILPVFRKYEEAKLAQNLMDFDDLQTKWLYLLQNHPEVLAEYSQKFEHILVDEYQDTNLIQSQIIDLLASTHRNLMVVGDDSQSIYSFRGAEFRNIIDFPKRYPNCEIYKLELNHRSTPEILEFANDSISNAVERFEKILRPVRKRGVTPALASFQDVYKQASFVAQRVLELHDEGIPLSEMAVIYRSHYHCLELQMELTRRRIPHEVRSGMRLFEEAHIKDILAYLKVFHNPVDSLSWLRILKLIPGVGQKTAEKIVKLAKNSAEPLNEITKEFVSSNVSRGSKEPFIKFQALIKVLSQMINNPSIMMSTIVENGYADYLRMTYPNGGMRIDEIEELSNYAKEYDIEGFLSTLALLGGASAEEIAQTPQEKQKESVVLTTVHQAKGLEWKIVFVIWLAEGRFPSYLTFNNPKELEEERRLFYVASTRSKDQLYLTYPIVYHSREGEIVLKASRFIKEISEHRYEKWLVEDEKPVFKRDDNDNFTISGKEDDAISWDDYGEFKESAVQSKKETGIRKDKFFWEK